MGAALKLKYPPPPLRGLRPPQRCWGPMVQQAPPPSVSATSVGAGLSDLPPTVIGRRVKRSARCLSKTNDMVSTRRHSSALVSTCKRLRAFEGIGQHEHGVGPP